LGVEETFNVGAKRSKERGALYRGTAVAKKRFTGCTPETEEFWFWRKSFLEALMIFGFKLVSFCEAAFGSFFRLYSGCEFARNRSLYCSRMRFKKYAKFRSLIPSFGTL